MNKITLVAGTFLSVSAIVAVANATSIVKSSCTELSNGDFELIATASDNLSDDATLTIGSSTGLTGSIDNDEFWYTGSVDCEDNFSIVDGSTTYDLQ